MIISYFIVAHFTFTTKFSSNFKSQFEVTFGQDSLSLNMSSFQASHLLQNSMKSLLTNWWLNVCSYLYSFCNVVLSPLASTSFVLRYLLFAKQTVLSFFFICLQMVAFDTSGMISFLIFVNKSFLALDSDSAS